MGAKWAPCQKKWYISKEMALTPSKDVMKILDTWYEGPPIETDRVQQIIINETKLIYNKVQHLLMLMGTLHEEKGHD